jgi:23S rRNA pseudouridine2605 synthase
MTDHPTDNNSRMAPPDGEGETEGRIQKMLARAGIGSRRQIEQSILDGKVFVNGRLATLGDRCSLQDRVIVNGHPINLLKRCTGPTRVLLYHKPIGEIVSRRDPEGRPVIFTQLPRLENGRWIAIGRLDINTQGLLLVTNNGELANRLMHPGRQVEREYAVRIFGHVGESLLQRLKDGITLEDGPAHFELIRAAGGEAANQWFHVVVREGRNRLVRRLWESQEVTVSRLIRVRFGDVMLPPRLRAGTSMELAPDDLSRLMGSVGMAESRDRDDRTSKPQRRDSERADVTVRRPHARPSTRPRR